MGIRIIAAILQKPHKRQPACVVIDEAGWLLGRRSLE